MQPFSCQHREQHISKAWFLEHVHFLIWDAAIADESFSRSAEKIFFLQLEPKKAIFILIQRALSFESVASFLWTCLLTCYTELIFSGFFWCVTFFSFNIVNSFRWFLALYPTDISRGRISIAICQSHRVFPKTGVFTVFLIIDHGKSKDLRCLEHNFKISHHLL
jgi:hypothetical protein